MVRHFHKRLKQSDFWCQRQRISSIQKHNVTWSDIKNNERSFKYQGRAKWNPSLLYVLHTAFSHDVTHFCNTQFLELLWIREQCVNSAFHYHAIWKGFIKTLQSVIAWGLGFFLLYKIPCPKHLTISLQSRWSTADKIRQGIRLFCGIYHRKNLHNYSAVFNLRRVEQM